MCELCERTDNRRNVSLQAMLGAAWLLTIVSLALDNRVGGLLAIALVAVALGLLRRGGVDLRFYSDGTMVEMDAS